MAPRNLGASVLEAYKDDSSEQQENILDHNGNETTKPTIKKNTNVPKAFSREEINDKSRTIIQNCLSHLDTNLNVLVLGGKDAGKSSLINSMNMSLTKEWKDVANCAQAENMSSTNVSCCGIEKSTEKSRSGTPEDSTKCTTTNK